jgi:hypothetical protein
MLGRLRSGCRHPDPICYPPRGLLGSDGGRPRAVHPHARRKLRSEPLGAVADALAPTPGGRTLVTGFGPGVRLQPSGNPTPSPSVHPYSLTGAIGFLQCSLRLRYAVTSGNAKSVRSLFEVVKSKNLTGASWRTI